MCLASKKLFEIVKYQCKLILTATFVLAIALCLLTPVMFGTRYLDKFGSSFVLERFVSLIGIVLLTPLFMPELDNNIAELVQSKRTSHTATILLRLVISLLFMAFCVVAMIITMRLWHCEFEVGKFIIGTFASAFFLGAIGFAFHALTNNVVVGYLAAITYYLLNFTMGSKLKAVYLFSLSKDSFTEKFWLLGIGAFILFASLWWKSIATKRR